MLVEKEVIGPGVYWYKDEATGLPRKLTVTPELTKHWCDSGNAMLTDGLPVPVPYEHDFSAHPMTPREQLLNNAGEVKQYTLKGNRLFSTVDVQDPDVKKKIGSSIRWTSPWFSSFTDGNGKEWKNVISHLALTTRPRITAHKQEPFKGIAAALSMASDTPVANIPDKGFCLSKAGRLFEGKNTKRLRPRYPMAFSMWAGGIPLAEGDMPFKKKKGAAKPGKQPGGKPSADPGAEPEQEFDGDLPEDEAAESAADNDAAIGGIDPVADPLADANGDIGMEELLCDLLQALGVPMPDESNEAEFQRHLYEAAMSKIKELTSKGMGDNKDSQMPDQNKPPGSNPHTSQPNPLIQQEQQPMYMSLEDINKLPDPMKGVALAMYSENQKLRAEMEADKKVVNSLRDAKLKEAGAARTTRVGLLGRLSPRVKSDLDAMLALPTMALSMGDGGVIIDPLESTLAVLEKGLADIPRLLMTDRTALAIQPQPTDESTLTGEREDEISDSIARSMGCPPVKKAS
jgi:hypothetical protein